MKSLSLSVASSRSTWAMVLVGLLVSQGCGDDDAPPPAPVTKPGEGSKTVPKRRVAQNAAAKKSASQLRLYDKVEDLVGEEDAKRMRRRFVATDFQQDITGMENRDPFRSYVVQLPGSVSSGDRGPTVPVTKVCTPKNMVAPDPRARDPRARRAYAIRDLRLTGIVLRGTQSYALFTDTSNYGHIVRRGDCVGKEKARVTRIGAGFVRLEIVPETSPNTPPGPPQKREIQLHPEELEAGTGGGETEL